MAIDRTAQTLFVEQVFLARHSSFFGEQVQFSADCRRGQTAHSMDGRLDSYLTLAQELHYRLETPCYGAAQLVEVWEVDD